MNKKSTLENNNRPLAYDTAVRQQRRFAIQQIVLACFADHTEGWQRLHFDIYMRPRFERLGVPVP